MFDVQLYAMQNAGGSTSIQPVTLDVDGIIRKAS
jgi:hypothetical protein